MKLRPDNDDMITTMRIMIDVTWVGMVADAGRNSAKKTAEQ
jgi:hypothetical protein